MLQSDDQNNFGEQIDQAVNRVQGSTMTFQVDNGSATTTTPHEKLVDDYKLYPENKRPTLTSATQHSIQSLGKGIVGFEASSGKQERFTSKVTPGILHNIL